MTDPAANPPATPSATLDCPNCQTEITYYDVANSYYYGCPNCHAYFKYENDDPPVVLETFADRKSTPAIPVGAEGYLLGQWVRMVGYAVKRERGTTYEWREYYLLLRDGTYRQLAEYNDHWLWVGPTDKPVRAFDQYGSTLANPASSSRGAYASDGEGRHRLYNKYTPELLYAVGEFDYNLLDEARLAVVEYIAPPSMLVAEIEGEMISWYRGEHIDASTVQEGFALPDRSLHEAYGVGAVQPNPIDHKWTPVVRVWAVAGIAGLLLHLFVAILNPHSQYVLNQSFTLPPDTVGTPAKTIRSTSFQLNGPTHVGVDFYSALDNRWAEFETDLVNEKSGQSYSFTKTIEYYQGVEDGEHWTEGSTRQDATLSRIPSGRYHLAITPTTDAFGLTVNVLVTAGPAPFSNVLIWLLLISMYPAYLYFKGQWFERDRWANSDYGPES